MKMNRSFLLRIWTLGWLTAIWVLLWGNVSAANILGGLAVGLLIMVLLPLPRVPVEGRIHVFSLVKLAVVFLYYAAESSVSVAWLAIRPKAPPVTGVLRCRIAIKSDLVLTLFVDAMNLVPGTMVLEIDRTRRLLYVHVLDMGTQKAVDGFYAYVRHLEKLFIAGFERDSDWKPSPLHYQEYERYHGVLGDDPVEADSDAPRDDKKTDDKRKGDWS
ncbi:MAG: Na+/H+ antiporter subunit E [Rhodococcus sp.]|jgi:multicomponent Na+:H+ antiporter subunit E|uniref:Na+/H+ antiporter subunit E n=2 Tax=Mycobacteriales TaxID=85007 RepID=UPI00050C5CCB|nr:MULTISPECIES: Na+/H+ antiporter subunit E [Rhodococcus]MBJ7324175.1 Na+/H+ antiporter subunit E [Rhodococcus sp. (in: high G+C Gram-positive bacteria)]MBW4782053.1 Na+/H+ antiporter subunit E [Rhodococcus fascians]MCX6491561.1 Na+/H+ antiporter subunit E [Rhodococcus sp. (in: high G+C Gram-positive bacteria)]MDJ0005689.1 Na+/H+ antiporter subunit E [Rhodococcus fascians]